MSNVFHNTGIGYFQLPKAFIPIQHDLYPSALRLYLVICAQAQRFSRSDLEFTNAQLISEAGISPNSLAPARIALVEHGLIQVERINGRDLYRLCDPETKQPIGRRQTTAAPALDRHKLTTISVRNGSTRWVANFFQALSAEEKRRYFEMKLTGRRPTTGGFMALCPLHPDSKASLKVETESGTWYCHGCKQSGGMLDLEMKSEGCNKQSALFQIADLLGRRDLIRPLGKNTAEKTFDYFDENGNLLYQIRRYSNKVFAAFRPDPTSSGWEKGLAGVPRVLYRLPEIIRAKLVLVNEGEQHCDRCKEIFREPDIAATTNPFGAGSWRDDSAPIFKGKGVFIIPDNDEAGRQHANAVAQSVSKFASEVRIVNLPDLPPGGDAIDFLDKHSKEELMRECANTPPWKPGAKFAFGDLKTCGL